MIKLDPAEGSWNGRDPFSLQSAVHCSEEERYVNVSVDGVIAVDVRLNIKHVGDLLRAVEVANVEMVV